MHIHLIFAEVNLCLSSRQSDLATQTNIQKTAWNQIFLGLAYFKFCGIKIFFIIFSNKLGFGGGGLFIGLFRWLLVFFVLYEEGLILQPSTCIMNDL